MANVQDEREPRPTFLKLPPEIRSAILRRVFPSRVIRFVAGRAQVLEETGNSGKILHEWRLDFSSANRQLHTEGRATLCCMISKSTLVLDGIFPESRVSKYRVDRFLHTRRMLGLFLRQYSKHVSTLMVMNAPNADLELSYFGGLTKVTFEQEMFTAFQVSVLNVGVPGGHFRIPFPDYESGATDEEVQAAILRRWKELRAMDYVPEFAWRYATIAAFQEEVDQSRERRKVDVLIVLRLVSASSFRSGNSRAGQIRLVIDGNTNEVLSFRRP